MGYQDNVVPGPDWEFNEDVAKCFNDMISRSVPGYTDMRILSYALGKEFVNTDSYVLDLGASTGEALRPYISDNIAKGFIGLESSLPMLTEMRTNFPQENVSAIEFNIADLDDQFRDVSLVLSILTMMFVPQQHRDKIICAIYKMLPPGGAFIMVEKVLGRTLTIDKLLVRAYDNVKLSNGYTLQDIDRKKVALDGVLVPKTTNTNFEMMRNAGFRNVDCFYKNLNFAGWIAIK